MVKKMITKLDQILQQARKGVPIRVAVAAAQDEAALSAVLNALEMGIVDAELFGDAKEIEKIADNPQLLKKATVHSAANPLQAAEQAIQAIRNGQAELLLKGQIKTAELLRRVLDAETGLRTGQLLSDVFVCEWPTARRIRLIMITDGGVNLKPSLNDKIQILTNAVGVCQALGNPLPKVAILSAIETINPNLQSTQDAAILTKMNQRGQIPGCIVDGPLALDNALSAEAAAIKGIHSAVAGAADILLCPDIESANILAKSTTYFARLRLAHVLIGAKVPVLIPSRADTADSKLLSIALGKIVYHHQIEAGGQSRKMQ